MTGLLYLSGLQLLKHLTQISNFGFQALSLKPPNFLDLAQSHLIKYFYLAAGSKIYRHTPSHACTLEMVLNLPASPHQASEDSRQI